MNKTPSSDNNDNQDGSSAGGANRPTKTPLYQANSSERYFRQALIKKAQNLTNRSLICYVSGNRCIIDDNDIMPFVDLLHNLTPDHPVDLLLHTKGGDIDAAEKLVGLLRRFVGESTFRIIVPDFAKSAGTLMVLGADAVVMSDTSELGPIDPQTQLFGRWQSVQNYLDAYRAHEASLEKDPTNQAAQKMLGKLDPTTLKLCEVAISRARQAAENLLRRGMFRNEGNWSLTASELLDTARWLSHGQMISWEDACDPHIGLVVHHLEYHSVEWQAYWNIYCHQRLAVQSRQKLYESDYASLVMGPAGDE